MVLITGGAGYIGSHLCKKFKSQNIPFVVLDNLSSGNRSSLDPKIPFYPIDLRDVKSIIELFQKYQFESVIHLAGCFSVAESQQNPQKFYDNNCVSTFNLLNACRQFKIKKFIFSSSCTVYGDPGPKPVAETENLNPVSNYGLSKLLCENFIVQSHKMGINPFNHLILRLFNVSGAALDGTLGQTGSNSNTFINKLCAALTNSNHEFFINGKNYDTKDGSCVRDFIHIEDVCEALLKSYKQMLLSNESYIFNLGSEKGLTLLQIANKIKNEIASPLKIKLVDRQSGDASEITADTTKLKKWLNWSPKHSDLKTIFETAFHWENRSKSPIAD